MGSVFGLYPLSIQKIEKKITAGYLLTERLLRRELRSALQVAATMFKLQRAPGETLMVAFVLLVLLALPSRHNREYMDFKQTAQEATTVRLAQSITRVRTVSIDSPGLGMPPTLAHTTTIGSGLCYLNAIRPPMLAMPDCFCCLGSDQQPQSHHQPTENTGIRMFHARVDTSIAGL